MESGVFPAYTDINPKRDFVYSYLNNDRIAFSVGLINFKNNRKYFQLFGFVCDLKETVSADIFFYDIEETEIETVQVYEEEGILKYFFTKVLNIVNFDEQHNFIDRNFTAHIDNPVLFKIILCENEKRINALNIDLSLKATLRKHNSDQLVNMYENEIKKLTKFINIFSATS